MALVAPDTAPDLPQYVDLALNSAGIVSDSTIYEAAHLDRKTADAYERLLSNLFVLDVVPAWLTNRLSRLVKTSKRYLTDASLVGASLRIDRAGVMRDGDLLGRVLDTFVAAQLRPEIDASARRPRSRLPQLRVAAMRLISLG